MTRNDVFKKCDTSYNAHQSEINSVSVHSKCVMEETYEMQFILL